MIYILQLLNKVFIQLQFFHYLIRKSFKQFNRILFHFNP